MFTYLMFLPMSCIGSYAVLYYTHLCPAVNYTGLGEISHHFAIKPKKILNTVTMMQYNNANERQNMTTKSYTSSIN